MQKKRRQRLVGGSRARVTDRLLRLRCVGKFGAPIAEKAAAMLCCKPGRFYTPSSWCRLLEDHQGAASGALTITESCFKGSFFLINDDMELLSQLYRIFNCNSFIFRCTFCCFPMLFPRQTRINPDSSWFLQVVLLFFPTAPSSTCGPSLERCSFKTTRHQRKLHFPSPASPNITSDCPETSSLSRPPSSCRMIGIFWLGWERGSEAGSRVPISFFIMT